MTVTSSRGNRTPHLNICVRKLEALPMNANSNMINWKGLLYQGQSYQRERDTERETERHRETEIDTERHRETQRQREKHRDTERDTETHTERDKETERNTETKRDTEHSVHLLSHHQQK